MIAALSAIEEVVLAVLYISAFVPPGGSGEFAGLNRLAPTLFSVFLFPPLIFTIVLLLVLHYYSPGTQKDFRRFAWTLLLALATVPMVLVFHGARPSGTPWQLVMNLIVLFVGTIVVLWRRVIRDEDSSPQTSA